eukprot:scaffold2436_cov80-Skeletonema_dohrnii-CCMP3373.AAC.4
MTILVTDSSSCMSPTQSSVVATNEKKGIYNDAVVPAPVPSIVEVYHPFSAASRHLHFPG